MATTEGCAGFETIKEKIFTLVDDAEDQSLNSRAKFVELIASELEHRRDLNILWAAGFDILGGRESLIALALRDKVNERSECKILVEPRVSKVVNQTTNSSIVFTTGPKTLRGMQSVRIIIVSKETSTNKHLLDNIVYPLAFVNNCALYMCSCENETDLRFERIDSNQIANLFPQTNKPI